MEEAKEFTYPLNTPFEYAYKGEQREAEFITLLPPSMQQHSQAASLKQSFTRIATEAFGEADPEEIEKAREAAKEAKETKEANGPEDLDKTSDEDNDGDTGGVTPEVVLTMIYGSRRVEVNVVWEQAKALFKAGVALVDGEQKLTKPLLDKMDPPDFELLVGTYIANFMLV